MVRVFFWDIHFVINYHFVVIFVSVFFVDFHFVVVHRFIITEWMAQGDLWNFKGDGYVSFMKGIPSLKLTVRPWKWMVGILLSFWDGRCWGTMLVSGRVLNARDTQCRMNFVVPPVLTNLVQIINTTWDVDTLVFSTKNAFLGRARDYDEEVCKLLHHGFGI